MSYSCIRLERHGISQNVCQIAGLLPLKYVPGILKYKCRLSSMQQPAGTAVRLRNWIHILDDVLQASYVIYRPITGLHISYGWIDDEGNVQGQCQTSPSNIHLIPETGINFTDIPTKILYEFTVWTSVSVSHLCCLSYLIVPTVCVKSTNVKSSVVAEWYTLLFRIQEVPGLNIGPGTGCPDWAFL